MTIDWSLIVLILACFGAIVLAIKLIKKFASAFFMIIVILLVGGFAGYQGMEYGKTQTYNDDCQKMYSMDFYEIEETNGGVSIWCLDVENNELNEIIMVQTYNTKPAPVSTTTSTTTTTKEITTTSLDLVCDDIGEECGI